MKQIRNVIGYRDDEQTGFHDITGGVLNQDPS